MKKSNEIPSDEFVGEFEKMDLSKLYDRTFVVMVSTGDRNGASALASTVHGPYNFHEMVEEVAMIWREHQHHAKAFTLNKDRDKGTMFLDSNTIDYIEAKYDDILVESLIDSPTDGCTCEAELNVDSKESPLAKKVGDGSPE